MFTPLIVDEAARTTASARAGGRRRSDRGRAGRPKGSRPGASAAFSIAPDRARAARAPSRAGSPGGRRPARWSILPGGRGSTGRGTSRAIGRVPRRVRPTIRPALRRPSTGPRRPVARAPPLGGVGPGADGDPPRDAEQPGGDRPIPIDPAESTDQHQEGRLEGVAGIVVAEDRPADAQNHRPVPLDQDRERRLVTPSAESVQQVRRPTPPARSRRGTELQLHSRLRSTTASVPLPFRTRVPRATALILPVAARPIPTFSTGGRVDRKFDRTSPKRQRVNSPGVPQGKKRGGGEFTRWRFGLVFGHLRPLAPPAFKTE